MRFLWIWIGGLLAVGGPVWAGSAYHLEATWGGTGTDAGRFREPMGIDADAKGFIYIADARNHRIQKLDSDGKAVLRFGEPGNGPGQFEKPVDIAVAQDGTIYAGDYDLDRIQAFSPEGEFLFNWGEPGEGPGQFRSPAGLAVGPDGNVYVADFYNNRIQVFDPKGKWSRTIGKKGRGSGGLNYPTDLAFDGQGNLIVADAYNHRLQKFTPQGEPLESWGVRWKRFLGLSSAFHVPSGVAVDGRGNVHVADSANKRVVLLDSGGNFEGDWKLTSDANPGVYSPTRVAALADGRVLAVDTGNDRILVLRLGPPSKQGAPEPRASAGAKPARGDILVRIDGMACPFCAYGIEKHLKGISGVQAARVNLGEGTVELDVAPEQEVPHEAIRQAVEKAGFKASEIKAITSTTKEKSQ